MNTTTIRSSRPSQAAVVIYQTLKQLSNDNAVFISYNELAKRAGYSRTSVISAVNRLILQHLILKQTECDDEKGHLRNFYLLA